MSTHRNHSTKLSSAAAAAIDSQRHAMIQNMSLFFADMVNQDSMRFYSKCFPMQGERIHQPNTIRDLAAAWDASKTLRYMTQHSDDSVYIPEHVSQHLVQAIRTTLQFYQSTLVPILDGTQDKGDTLWMLDTQQLEEPSNIAHSALLIFASIGSLHLKDLAPEDLASLHINGLVQGILSRQRTDGAFRVTFDIEKDPRSESNIYQGIEFYPGEAMVALMEAYSVSLEVPNLLQERTRLQILDAMDRAFAFYSNYYRQGDADINYNIWQIQAFSRLFEVWNAQEPPPDPARLVANYVLDLCREIMSSKAWKYELARGPSFYPNLETIEIACGLDALADGLKVARSVNDPQSDQWERSVQNAVDFLSWTQDQVPLDVSVGRGGLGFGGVVVREQRLDVTGHALSALVKL